MQPASPRIIELFNDALTFELTVTNTYFLHARMLDNWGLPKLGKVFYELSIDEMKDADDIINRILMFDIGDHASAAVFEAMARDEEKRAEWFEGQLDALERVGVENYLATQIEAGEAP